MHTTMEMLKLFISTHIIIENKFFNGGILTTEEGKIKKVIGQEEVNALKSCDNVQVFDVYNLVIMPGIIDSHVHVNEPGRTSWEGFETATKAAAAGGITTIVDMPLNSNPPTTTVSNFNEKLQAAKGKTYVDVAFWGGLVPGNLDELMPLVKKGVVGFKGFMSPSGIEEFQYLEENDIEMAYKALENTNTVLAFHAELENTSIIVQGKPSHYETYLKTRPPSTEVAAVAEVINLSQKHNVPTHIVHVSSAECLPLIAEAKKKGAKLTAETCHHYLYFEAEKIPAGATQYKCCPPIRDLENQHRLWEGLKNGVLDMVVSDHSPSTPDLKQLRTGDFLQAWGGISSLQFGLSIFWTRAKNFGFSIFDITRYMTNMPSKLAGLEYHKGVIAPNYDADFVIWNPNETFVVREAIIQHKNKLTPYLGQTLHGKVYMTVVRGQVVYQEGRNFSRPAGRLLVDNK